MGVLWGEKMFNLFKNNKNNKNNELNALNRQMEFTFSKLGHDVNKIQHWLSHLHDKNEHLLTSHHTHVEVTKKDLSTVNRWIHHLNHHNLELQRYLKELTSYLVALQNKDSELLERIHSLEKKITLLDNLSFNNNGLSLGHDGTQKRTFERALNDMSSPLIKQKESILHETVHPVSSSTKSVINKSQFTGSQIELLNVLYEADKPLSYNDLSRFLNKKSKSVRNLIYELRDKGIEIKSRFVGLRTKGFYLSKEAKIQISGR